MTYSLLKYLSVSVLCLLFALPLSAQESTMEQFMSAHSMSMLTADSVDPNHDDLVITALAMQQLTMTSHLQALHNLTLSPLLLSPACCKSIRHQAEQSCSQC